MTPNPRPLILYPHEVRAALAGTLAEIWRPVRPSMRNCDEFVVMECFQNSDAVWPFNSWDESEISPYDGCEHPIPCPFGPVGTELWGRETWATRRDLARHVEYRASHQEPADHPFGHIYDEKTCWRSAATMPLWASRIRLENAGVEVRRVQTISEEEARGAGAVGVANGLADGFGAAFGLEHLPHASAFATDWNRRYAKRGLAWAANPFCWRGVVRRVKA